MMDICDMSPMAAPAPPPPPPAAASASLDISQPCEKNILAGLS